MLRQPHEAVAENDYDQWISIGTVKPGIRLPAERAVPDSPEILESAFEEIRDIWWKIGRTLSSQPTGEVSHTAACASFGSDFGLMLAWDNIVGRLAKGRPRTLAICSDPFLFRHLSGIPNVDAGAPPTLVSHLVRLGVRGLLSRILVSGRVACAAARMRKQRAKYVSAQPGMLVYGHPASNVDGTDAYFGDLLHRTVQMWRVLHTDCRLKLAQTLSAGERTVSLHAWGNPFYAILRLPFSRWRPSSDTPECARYAWLIRRAAARENGGGTPAMNRWQLHCQARWLKAAQPETIVWPWENFSWERSLVRDARQNGLRTVGYQHTVIGPHQFNYSLNSNPDGLNAIPDTVVADGPAYRTELIEWGVPEEIVVDGGSFRIKPPARRIDVDNDAPVYFALSANLSIAAQQLEVARRVSQKEIAVVVKQHPMYPIGFDESEFLKRTEKAIGDFKNLRRVVYSTGASAIDALMSGVPSIRLRFDNSVSIDVLPKNIKGEVADPAEILSALESVVPAPSVEWSQVFSPVNYQLWASLLKTSRDSVN